MSAAIRELQEALCRYTTDTLTYIDKVRGFCEGISTWEKELSKLRDIKDRADKVNLSLSHVTKSKSKGKALGKYIKNKVSDKRREELETELAAVLEVTLGGLEELDHFLEAVEKLVVTSLHVFKEENQVLYLPKGINLKHVQLVIAAARLICPLLLEFKRDASVFFLPKLQNVEVLSYQLDKYIETTRTICDKLKKSGISDLYRRMGNKPLIDLDVDLSEDEIQRMLCHINQLDKIRMDQHFRLVFLFQDVSCSGFIDKFKEQQPRMLQFLTDLEEVAVQLDKMNKGAKISSVAGSSVGAVGGVLSIVGLALIPLTAGVSLGLTIGGVALGLTSGVNSAVTTATEIGVNHTQQKKANEVFQSFMEDVQSLQGCLEEVIGQKVAKIEESGIELVVGVGKVLGNVGTVGKGTDSLVDAVSAVKEVKALRNVPRVASDIPDIGQAAVKGPLALTKSARAGFIALNALFLGMDVFFICKDSYSLSKGSETEVSKFIRARAALWSSEMDSWKNIRDSLCKGQKTSEEHRAVLDEPFYSERAIKKNESLWKVLPASKKKPVALVKPFYQETAIKKNESLCKDLPAHAVLDKPFDPERAIKKNDSLCKVLPARAVLDKPFDPERAIKKNDSLCKGQKTSEDHRAILVKPFDPERAIKRNESFQTRMVNRVWVENIIVLCIVIAVIAFVATKLSFNSD